MTFNNSCLNINLFKILRMFFYHIVKIFPRPLAAILTIGMNVHCKGTLSKKQKLFLLTHHICYLTLFHLMFDQSMSGYYQMGLLVNYKYVGFPQTPKLKYNIQFCIFTCSIESCFFICLTCQARKTAFLFLIVSWEISGRFGNVSLNK